jgi:hypothetical protein
MDSLLTRVPTHARNGRLSYRCSTGQRSTVAALTLWFAPRGPVQWCALARFVICDQKKLRGSRSREGDRDIRRLNRPQTYQSQVPRRKLTDKLTRPPSQATNIRAILRACGAVNLGDTATYEAGHWTGPTRHAWIASMPEAMRALRPHFRTYRVWQVAGVAS